MSEHVTNNIFREKETHNKLPLMSLVVIRIYLELNGFGIQKPQNKFQKSSTVVTKIKSRYE